MNEKWYNWCGWAGSFSFSNLVRKNLDLLPKYKQEKALLFWQEFEIEVCKPHDREFYEWWGLFAFLRSNIIFTYRFTMKLWWTSLWLQILSFPVISILMICNSWKYWHWCLPSNKRKAWKIWYMKSDTTD